MSEDRLSEVTGGAARPRFVSSFFCEKCGKTIRLNGVYSPEKARQEHDAKEHAPGKNKK